MEERAMKTATTVEAGRQMFAAAGLTISEARTWTREDGKTWLFSVETLGRGTYGHPRLEVLCGKGA
jgi:hypothetical protein